MSPSRSYLAARAAELVMADAEANRLAVKWESGRPHVAVVSDDGKPLGVTKFARPDRGASEHVNAQFAASLLGQSGKVRAAAPFGKSAEAAAYAWRGNPLSSALVYEDRIAEIATAVRHLDELAVDRIEWPTPLFEPAPLHAIRTRHTEPGILPAARQYLELLQSTGQTRRRLQVLAGEWTWDGWGHNDLRLSNLLLDDLTDAVWIIDWELAGPTFALWDHACLVGNAAILLLQRRERGSHRGPDYVEALDRIVIAVQASGALTPAASLLVPLAGVWVLQLGYDHLFAGQSPTAAKDILGLGTALLTSIT